MATAHSKQGPESGAWFQSHWNQWCAQQHAQWDDFFKGWQRTVSGGNDAAGGANAYRQFFVQAGGQFIDLLQNFYAATGQNKSPEDAAKDWTSGMQKFFVQMSEPANLAETQRSFATMGESMMRAGMAWAGAFQNPGAKNTQGMFDPFGFAASMPGIGYTREKQEAYNELYRRWSTFERASAKYNNAMAKVGLEAVMKFQGYIMNPPKDAPPLTSLKSIYVKWVDICEEIYARYAMSEEYTSIYGETVNALMAFKKQQNAIVDGALDEMNLPTRKEIDALHERAHALRRDNIALKKELAELKKAVLKTKPAPKAAAKKKGKK